MIPDFGKGSNCVVENRLFCPDWVRDNWSGTLQPALVEHVKLTLLAVAVGFVLSFGAALVTHRLRLFEKPLVAFAAIVYTIPSLALFQLLVPVTGLTVATVEVALVGYTLLILYRNILEGLRNVPPDVLEAARGMGLTRGQTLWRIELPLAVPATMAGLRVAVVSTIALATVAALVIPQGLGYPIFIALREAFKTEILVAGALAVAPRSSRTRCSCSPSARSPRGTGRGGRRDREPDGLRRRARVHRGRAAPDPPEDMGAPAPLGRSGRDRGRDRPAARHLARPSPPRLVPRGQRREPRTRAAEPRGDRGRLRVHRHRVLERRDRAGRPRDPPILTNAYVAVDGVQTDAVEAARGMGMTRRQIVTRVELPLALPLIFVGIRTAIVFVVATATIAAVAGGGGLGDIIVNQAGYGLAGVVGAAICVSVLALLADGAVGLLQRALTPPGLRVEARSYEADVTSAPCPALVVPEVDGHPG